jgi:TonB family protein
MRNKLKYFTKFLKQNRTASVFSQGELRKRRLNMTVRLIAALVILCSILVSTLAWGEPGPVDQIVVDKSTRNKALNDYTLLTRDCIQRAWTTPVDLSVPGALKGKVSVNYVVKRSGAVDKVELVRSSGNPEMDRTLLLAIRNAAPFPPFPEGVEAKRIMIRANFVVADLPTMPIITATHDLPKDKSEAESSRDNSKKYIWGAPAGSSTANTDETTVATPPAPPQKRYKWGVDK